MDPSLKKGMYGGLAKKNKKGPLARVAGGGERKYFDSAEYANKKATGTEIPTAPAVQRLQNVRNPKSSLGDLKIDQEAIFGKPSMPAAAAAVPEAASAPKE